MCEYCTSVRLFIRLSMRFTHLSPLLSHRLVSCFASLLDCVGGCFPSRLVLVFLRPIVFSGPAIGCTPEPMALSRSSGCPVHTSGSVCSSGSCHLSGLLHVACSRVHTGSQTCTDRVPSGSACQSGSCSLVWSIWYMLRVFLVHTGSRACTDRVPSGSVCNPGPVILCGPSCRFAGPFGVVMVVWSLASTLRSVHSSTIWCTFSCCWSGVSEVVVGRPCSPSGTSAWAPCCCCTALKYQSRILWRLPVLGGPCLVVPFGCTFFLRLRRSSCDGCYQ